MSEHQRPASAENQRISRLINAGVEVFGGTSASTAAAALGLLVAGPAGVAIGGATGAALSMAWRKLGSEIAGRLLSPREEARVGRVFGLAAAEIRERIEQGESLRGDGFFESKPAGRSDAEEVAESVLLKSQREPEEKKLPYVAHLLANLAFNRSIGVHMAHQITKAAEQLTYRQLCIMKLSVEKGHFGLRTTDYRGRESFPRELYQILYECLDLYHRGYINFGGEVAFGPTDVKPASMTVQGIGADMFNLMNLSSIPDEDIASIATRLE